ncbi:MAG: thioesterase family protein, partial [Calditrichaceae bacterium]
KTKLKVRTYECDSYGHVNNAAFLNYCEVARVELLDKMGFDLKKLMQEGFLLVIIKIEMEYKRPAFANDLLEVSVDWVERGKSSATFEQEIVNIKQDTLVARAKVIWVCTDIQGKPTEIPDILLNSFEREFGDLPAIKNK